MKTFNDYYKSYLKSIIKEDPDEIAEAKNAEDTSALTIDDIRNEYVGKKIVHKTLRWYEGYNEPDGESVSISTHENSIKEIGEMEDNPGKYQIILAKKDNFIGGGVNGNDFGFTVDGLLKVLEMWKSAPVFTVNKYSGRGEWYNEYKVTVERPVEPEMFTDNGWCFEENAPSDEDLKNALKDHILEKRRKLIEQAENFGKELGF